MQSQSQWSRKEVSRAGYHTTQLRNLVGSKGKSLTSKAILPLFFEKAHSTSMIKHGLKKQMEDIQHANPEQIPVSAMDQPLFALSKYLQRTYHALREPSSQARRYAHRYGNVFNKEQCSSRVWLSHSIEAGWHIWPWAAQAIIQGSPVTKARCCHQVTVMVLRKLWKEALEENPTSIDDEDAWFSGMKIKLPTFYFWDILIQMEIILLLCLSTQRRFRTVCQGFGMLHAICFWPRSHALSSLGKCALSGHEDSRKQPDMISRAQKLWWKKKVWSQAFQLISATSKTTRI